MPAGGNHNPQGHNSKKKSPPDDEIRPWIEYYANLNIGDTKMVKELKKHYDTSKYNLKAKTIYRMRQRFNITSTRQQKHTFDTIAAPVAEIRKRFPTKGAVGIKHMLQLDYKMKVPEKLILAYLKQTEPVEVQRRRGRRFKRKRFYSAGVNDVWGQDQHDKWRRFGLYLHNSIDPFTGVNNWLKVWWTNRNPRLIAKYYLDHCREMQGVPMTTQSDPGTENFGVANVQTIIRQILDPSLVGTRQHRFMGEHNNVKNEANWSVFRRTFSVGFENLFDKGVNEGLYDPSNPLQRLVFLWLVIPWLQAELDSWVYQRNHTKPRHDRHKILPHGIPVLIRDKPEDYGTKDFKVSVPSELFDKMEAKYAPPDHEVFQLTPPAFDGKAQRYYEGIGSPVVSTENLWDVYAQLLAQFQQADGEDDELTDVVNGLGDLTERVNHDEWELISNNETLPAVALPIAANTAAEAIGDESLVVCFSDESEEEELEEELGVDAGGSEVGKSMYAKFSDEDDSEES